MVEIFNSGDSDEIAKLYHEDAINHQLQMNQFQVELQSVNCLETSLQRQKWFALLRTYLRMENGQYWNGKIHLG